MSGQIRRAKSLVSCNKKEIEDETGNMTDRCSISTNTTRIR